MTNLELAQKIATILDDKKAIDVRIKKVGDLTVLTEYFVICNGTSNTHIKSLADEVEFKLKQEGITGHLEGKSSDWLLVTSAALLPIFSYRPPESNLIWNGFGQTRKIFQLRNAASPRKQRKTHSNNSKIEGMLTHESI